MAQSWGEWKLNKVELNIFLILIKNNKKLNEKENHLYYMNQDQI